MNRLIKPLRVTGIIAPILRPLPTIFSYARLTAASRGVTAPVLDDEYGDAVRALAAVIDRACRDAGAPAEDWQPVLDHLVEICTGTGAELATGLDGLCARLTELHQQHGGALRKAAAADQDGFRELYRSHVRPKKLLVCFSDGAGDQAESLERKLVDRCWYDYEAVEGDWSVSRTGTADLVVFAPSRRPIPDAVLAAVESYGMPLLILMGGDRAAALEDMALMKAEYLYRRTGYNVLRSPFMPPRLYSTIDSLYLHHLAGKLVALPDGARKAGVFTLEAAAGGD